MLTSWQSVVKKFAPTPEGKKMLKQGKGKEFPISKGKIRQSGQKEGAFNMYYLFFFFDSPCAHILEFALIWTLVWFTLHARNKIEKPIHRETMESREKLKTHRAFLPLHDDDLDSICRNQDWNSDSGVRG